MKKKAEHTIIIVVVLSAIAISATNNLVDSWAERISERVLYKTFLFGEDFVLFTKTQILAFVLASIVILLVLSERLDWRR